MKYTLKQLIYSDSYRHLGANFSFYSFLRGYILIPGIRFMFWNRVSTYCYQSNSFIVKHLLGRIIFFVTRHYCYKYGIDLNRGTTIGPGFYIGHFGGIVVSSSAIIGKNCNISQGVTIGVSGSGDKRGCPQIGDNVYIGSGAKLIGKIHIGNNVAIGANAVVTKDVPDNCIVAGIPARIIGTNNYTHIILNPYGE